MPSTYSQRRTENSFLPAAAAAHPPKSKRYPQRIRPDMERGIDYEGKEGGPGGGRGREEGGIHMADLRTVSVHIKVETRRHWRTQVGKPCEFLSPFVDVNVSAAAAYSRSRPREGGMLRTHAHTHQFHIGKGESQRASEQVSYVGISSFIRRLLPHSRAITRGFAFALRRKQGARGGV